MTDIETILRVENRSLKKDLETLRQQNQALIVEMSDIEDIAFFLINERRDPAGDDHLPYYGADLDEVRLRMGRPGRRRPVSFDDILIDAYQLLKWTEAQQTLGIEPPPSFFELKKHFAAIPPRQTKVSL